MSKNVTELFILLNSNKLDKLQSRLTRDNVNVRDAAVGDTLLLDAVTRSNVDAVRLLLGLGADLDPVSSEGNTPLVVAASRYNYDIAKLLLEAGADPNLRGNKGMTALRWAVTNPSGDFRLVRLLLEHGADPWIKTDAGGTAVTYAETVYPSLAEELKRAKPKT
jgi:ankyrin repeat protein